MIYTVDIGGTKTKFAWIDSDDSNNICFIKKGEFITTQNAENIINSIVANAPNNIEALGVSIGGFWESGKCTAYSTIKDFADGNFVKVLESRLNCPCAVDNDAHFALLSESKLGNLKKYKNAALITLGSSLGCSVKLNGEIFSGSTGQAAALFLMPEIYDGKNYVYDKHANSLHITSEYLDGKYYGNFKKVYLDYLDGSSDAKEYINNYIKTIALKCFYLYVMFDLEAIAIGGAIAQNAEIFEEIKNCLSDFFKFDESKRKPNIKKAILGNDANLLGAYFGAKEVIK